MELQTATAPIIERLIMTTCLGQQIDLVPQMISFTVMEDITYPFLTATVDLEDAVGYFDQLPIAGNETITIKFKSWDYADDNRKCDFIHRTMDVLRISDVSQINDVTKTYRLHLASPEFKKNETIRISKAYQSVSISDVIATILTEDYDSTEAEPRGLGLPTDPLQEEITRSPYLRDDSIQASYQKLDDNDSIEIFVEKTKYIEPFITVPYAKPFDIIEDLSARAIRLCGGRWGTIQNTQAANFMFFENKRGFQFVSLETLLENKSNSTTTFSFGNAAQNKATEERNVVRETIEKLQIVDSFDIINNIRTGLYASRLVQYDISNGELYTTDYNYNDEFYSTESTERGECDIDFPLIFQDVDGKSEISNKPFSRYMFVPTTIRGIDLISNDTSQRVNDTKELIGVQEYLQKRASQLARLNTLTVMMQVAGNSKHKVGDMVELDLRYLNATDGNAEVSEKRIKYYSGKYLITSIKHVVNSMNYTMFIELVKDSSKEKIGEFR